MDCLINILHFIAQPCEEDKQIKKKNKNEHTKRWIWLIVFIPIINKNKTKQTKSEEKSNVGNVIYRFLSYNY